MNPSPKYAAGKLSPLPAGVCIGSLSDASGFRVSLYQSTATAPADPGSPSGLRSLALRRRLSAVGAKKRRPNLTTPCNQLALALASRIESGENEAGVPKKDQRQFLKLLREAKRNPISADNRSTWSHLLTEVTIILDPMEHFPELAKVRSANGPKSVKHEKARFRSELLKFFDRALRNLLG